MVTRMLPFLGFGHQLLFAFAGRGLAFVPSYGITIPLDQFGGLAGAIPGNRSAAGQQFQFRGRDLVKSLTYVLRLVEGIGIGSVNIRVQHFLGCLGATEGGDRQQHRDDADIDRGEPPEHRLVAPVGVRMALRILMDSFGDLVRFHISLSGLMRKFRNLSQRISRRESARPQLSNILACAAFWPRERAAACGSIR
jgi:hypothetical protein